jgi:hypothetical protein
MTLGINGLCATLSIMALSIRSKVKNSVIMMCHYLFIVMLNVILLNVILLNVILLNVILLNVILLNVMALYLYPAH